MASPGWEIGYTRGGGLFLERRGSRRLLVHTWGGGRLHAGIGRELLLRTVAFAHASQGGAVLVAAVVSVAKLLVALERLAEDALLLLRRRSRRRRARHWRHVATDWRGLEVLVQHLNKVGGKQTDHAAVAAQAAHPP